MQVFLGRAATSNYRSDVVALLSATGETVAEWERGPFGEPLLATGNQAWLDACRIGFGSKYTDPETGLVYFGFRYYDPRHGRWMGREPLGEEESFNPYAYCGNDPVNNLDYLGLLEVNAKTAADAAQKIKDASRMAHALNTAGRAATLFSAGETIAMAGGVAAVSGVAAAGAGSVALGLLNPTPTPTRRAFHELVGLAAGNPTAPPPAPFLGAAYGSASMGTTPTMAPDPAPTAPLLSDPVHERYIELLRMGVAFEDAARGVPLIPAPLLLPRPGQSTVIPSQILINARNGRAFQDAVHEALRIGELKQPITVLLPSGQKVTTILDLWDPATGVAEIKNVVNIRFRRQLQAQVEIAKRAGEPFHMIISPRTQTISESLRDAVVQTGGAFFEFNPATGSFSVVRMAGSQVIRP